MIDGTLPGYWNNNTVSFTAASTTSAKILVDVSPAQVVAAISGETALPGESTVRQRVLTGGCRVIDGKATSSDSVARALLVYEGVQTSLYANMGTVATTATTNSTITRTVGSFITDGFQIGDNIMVFGAVSAANNGMIAIVTGVAAGTLTLSGTTAISVAETQSAGFRIIRVGAAYRKPVAITAGTDGTTAPVPIIGGTLDPRTDTTGISLGANGMLIVGMQATISALPAVVSVTANFGLY